MCTLGSCFGECRPFWGEAYPVPGAGYEQSGAWGCAYPLPYDVPMVPMGMGVVPSVGDTPMLPPMPPSLGWSYLYVLFMSTPPTVFCISVKLPETLGEAPCVVNLSDTDEMGGSGCSGVRVAYVLLFGLALYPGLRRPPPFSDGYESHMDVIGER